MTAAPVVFARVACPHASPWGEIDGKEEIAPGLWHVETPSHGGIWASPERLAAMPAELVAKTFGDLGQRGWFEEDCDWCLVALAFPDAFPPAQFEAARATASSCHAPAFAAWQAAGGGYATEPTDQGNQYVLPGCEKDRSRGPTQGDLF